MKKIINIILLLSLSAIIFANEANEIKNINVSGSPFTCIADGSDTCGCLQENDNSGLVWYRYSSRKKYSFNDAESSFVSSFNANGGHCGYTDWRLPNTYITYPIIRAGYANFGDQGLTGDYATLAAFATNYGYQYHGDLAKWMNSNGFGDGGRRNINDGPNPTEDYWTYSPANCGLGPCAWEVFMEAGEVDNGWGGTNLVLLVRGSN